MYLNIPQSTLAAQQALWTAKEIAQQPVTWRETANIVNASQIFSFIAPLIQRAQAGTLRIIFTGAGTSAFIGKVVAPILSQQLGCVVEAIASTDLVSNPNQYLLTDKATLLVSFARSGNSPESLAAVKLVNQIVTEPYHLAITNNVKGALFQDIQSADNTFAIGLPEITNDQGFAMTSSASNMMLASLLAFCPHQYDSAWVESVSKVAENLLQTELTSIQIAAEKPVKQVVFLGSGCFAALAQEAALKILELTAGERLAFFDSPLGFRHGPKSLVESNTQIFLFVSQDAYTQKYDVDLYQELIKDRKALAVNIVGASGQILASFCQGTEGLDDVARIFPYLVFAQCYAFYSSLQLGYTTDNPCPTGEVNRVVQGVYIYPF